MSIWCHVSHQQRAKDWLSAICLMPETLNTTLRPACDSCSISLIPQPEAPCISPIITHQGGSFAFCSHFEVLQISSVWLLIFYWCSKLFNLKSNNETPPTHPPPLYESMFRKIKQCHNWKNASWNDTIKQDDQSGVKRPSVFVSARFHPNKRRWSVWWVLVGAEGAWGGMHGWFL